MTLPVNAKCFWTGIFRVKTGFQNWTARFPEHEMFSVQIFRVKTEIQKWFPESGTDYGTADLGAGGWALPAPAPAGTGSPPAAGWRHRPRPPAPDRPRVAARIPATVGHGPARPRHGRTDGTGNGKPRPASRRGEAPARLRPELNKKAGNP